MPADICKQQGAAPGEVIEVDGKPYTCPSEDLGQKINTGRNVIDYGSDMGFDDDTILNPIEGGDTY